MPAKKDDTSVWFWIIGGVAALWLYSQSQQSAATAAALDQTSAAALDTIPSAPIPEPDETGVPASADSGMTTASRRARPITTDVPDGWYRNADGLGSTLYQNGQPIATTATLGSSASQVRGIDQMPDYKPGDPRFLGPPIKPISTTTAPGNPVGGTPFKYDEPGGYPYPTPVTEIPGGARYVDDLMN